ncbi:SIR2 family protein [Roseivirga spongicola]|uniref:SIR2 family protein n=1 Tax=Roseivirga spongicola TaxID=333140 RepID=UPI002AC97B3E|nr:SIR2 family protein [Roseivirga spongicola]WPZ08850.1 SIR2 family protein [Roseivirga spongicola]
MWKKEVYSDNFPDDKNISNETINEFLQKPENSRWYDSRNEYSSLFEKKYDLPRQRRMFIEEKVSSKVPSLGYAYLVKLVKSRFFKTIFTTNFDDLINEAFYRYSDERPIVCAHDSAISSITVTSKRPKIIKLHGDYLFDDIKSTLRETESLEDNIKNKFIEFAKDYGLIIVGYAGNDRSILDVIHYLLKQEEYFKNGIYWCFRRDSEINEDVKKILWKDRVYYVEIDGFDELMASLNCKLNNGELPIERSILSNRQNKFIESLVSNPKLKSTNSSIIKDDMERLKEASEEEVLSNFLDSMTKSGEKTQNHDEVKFSKKTDKNSSSASSEEKMRLIQLYESYRSKRYSDTLAKIDIILKKGSLSFKAEMDLKKLKVDCLISLKENHQAVTLIHELIEHFPNTISYRLKLANLQEDFSKKLELYDQTIAIDPYWFKSYNAKAAAIINEYKQIHNTTIDLKMLLETLDKSLQVSPGLDNDAWRFKKALITNDLYEDKKDKIEQLQLMSNAVEEQDPYSSIAIDIKVEIMYLSKADYLDIIQYLDTKMSKQKVYSDKHFLMKKLEVYGRFHKKTEVESLLRRIELDYNLDADFLEEMSLIQLELFGNIEKAREYLQQAIDLESTESRLKSLFNILLYQDRLADAKELFESKFHNDSDMHLKILEHENQWDESLALVKELLTEKPQNRSLLQSEVFLSLKVGAFDEAHKLARLALEPNNFTDSIFIINHELACKLQGKNIQKDRLNKVVNNPKAALIEKAGAYYLLGEKPKFYKKLEEAINEDQSIKYQIKKWVIFEDLKETRFKELIKIK